MDKQGKHPQFVGAKNMSSENTTVETTPAVATAKVAAPKAAKAATKPTKKVAKKAAPKTPAKPVKKVAKNTKAVATKPANGLTGNEAKILAALKGTSKDNKMLDRNQLIAKTGINGGWAKTLGAVTKGEADSTSLEGRGLVCSYKTTDVRTLQYYITAKGLKVLEASK